MSYEVTLIRGSFEPTAREKLKYQDFSGIEKIDTLFEGHDAEGVTVCGIRDYLLYAVHNDNTVNENTDYSQLVLITNTGDTYVTGSATFIRDFETIFSVIRSEETEPFDIKIRKMASRRYSGKYFLKVSVV